MQVSLKEVIDIIMMKAEDPDNYLYGVSRSLVITHAKRLLQELNYAGVRSVQIVIKEVLASGKIELPDDYVEYIRIYYCVGNYLLPAFFNDHINTVQWDAIKDYEEKLVLTATGRRILTPEKDFLSIMTKTGETVQNYGPVKDMCFLKGYKYNPKQNNIILDYVPDGVTHVAIEYVGDPLVSEPDVSKLSIHKYFQKALEAGVYAYIIESRRSVPMNEKIRAKKEWNIKYKDAVIELNNKPEELIQALMGWKQMNNSSYPGMGGQRMPESDGTTIKYKLEYTGFVCQVKSIEYNLEYTEFICQTQEAGEEEIVSMVTSSNSVSIHVVKSDENMNVSILWGDGVIEDNIHSNVNIRHVYTDGIESHEIKLTGERTTLLILDCAVNQLTQLDVSKSTALTTLFCNANQLTQLDISQNTALTILSCNNNKLTQLDVSSNIALTSISCYSNKLIQLDVSQNAVLDGLDCGSNQISQLDISKNTGLTKLDCGINQIAQLDVSKNTMLTSIWCGTNKLTQLDVSKNTALTKLHCVINQLTRLNIDNNTALTGLWCGANQIAQLDVSKNTALTGIDCTMNQLTQLDVSKNTALAGLWCGTNKLTQLDVSTNIVLERFECYGNPLITDNDALISLANSLVNRTGVDEGLLTIKNETQDLLIQSICDTKNWRIINT